MKKSVGVLLTIAVVASGGCVRKGTYDKVAKDYAACQADLATKATELTQKTTDLDACNAQWQEALKAFGGQAAKTENVLQGLREWKLNVEQSLPQQVKAQVEAELEILVRQLEQGFGALARDNARMAKALEQQNQEIASLGSNVNLAREDLIRELGTLRGDRQATSTGIADVVKTIEEWEQARLHCKECETRLRLNKKEVDAITALHSDVVSQLTRLQQ